MPDSPDAFLPPSRRAALELALAALGRGPILVTGDAGVGKTWLVDRLAAAVAGCRWARVDLTPADGPRDLYRHVARALGLESGPGDRPERIDVLDALADAAADGRSHGLIVDEAQNLAPEVWEEVRVLANRFGRPDGFAHLILVGQTTLVRRFATRALAAIEARLAAHLHVRPVEVAEAGAWLARLHPGLDWSSAEVEAAHRDSGGVPARLLRRSAAISARLAPANPARIAGPDPVPVAPAVSVPEAAPGRPPLHVEENSIEVGWSADEGEPGSADAADGPFAEEDESGRVVAGRLPVESDQAVIDHYAALQAWREWAANQERQANPAARSDRELADEIDRAAEAEAAEFDPDEAPAFAAERGSLRAEGYHQFAPFGQLFSRMPPVGEPETPRT